MSSPSATTDPLGAQVYRLPFPVQTAKRFVLGVFGGLTLMITIWTTLMLSSTVFSFEGETRGLFKGILVFFVTLIVVGFSVAWSILSRFPRALVVHERGLVHEHGSRTRALPFDQITGIDQRDADGTPTFVVLVKDGSEIPFGTDRDSEALAAALVKQAGLTWTEEPYRARRGTQWTDAPSAPTELSAP